VVADGEFGPITLRAVRGFQVSHGVRALRVISRTRFAKRYARRTRLLRATGFDPRGASVF
jgi:peptidoglycan hydrolase-like protein with peptidoglycan-binding domain